MADNRISPSKKEIYTKLLDIAEKYTDIENKDFLKTGLFGYITESLAMAIRDSSYQKTMLYNESFLNTAVIPKTVYNWAKMFGIEIQKATPAYADIEIKINKESLETAINNLIPTNEQREKFGLDSSFANKNAVILDKSDPIYAGDYIFSLEHSIIITKDNNDSIVAQYVNKTSNAKGEETATNYQADGSIPINLNVYFDEANENVIIAARAYQYQTQVITRQIPSSSFLNKVQTYTFENQFCGAKLFFISNSESKEVSLEYSELKNNVSDLVAFYNLNDEHELEIMFRYGDGYFMPTANSQIKLVLYSTNGAKVPSTFSGDAYMMISNNDLKALPVVIQFNPTNIIGGKNAPSIDEIKRTIINEISTRNTITTKSDLNKYFAIITSLIEDINDGSVEFKKQRDDILKRAFNAYLLLRDNVDEINDETAGAGYLSSCVPTNTITGKINSLANGDNRYFYSFPKFDGTSYEYLSQVPEGNHDYYISPFSLFIIPSTTDGSTPCAYVKFLYNLVNQTTELEYINASDTSGNTENESDYIRKNHYIQPKSATLTRNFDDGFEPSKYYLLTLEFLTDFPLGKIDDESGYTVSERDDAITLKFDNGSAFGISTAVSDSVECSSIRNENNTYTVDISMKIKISSESEFDFPASYDVKQNLASDNGYEIQINAKNNIYIDMSKFIVTKEDDSFNFGNNFMVRDLVFFEHMDTIMDSSLGQEENKTTTGSGSSAVTTIESYDFTISELPVIHSSFLEDKEGNEVENAALKRDGFTKQLFTYIRVLKKNLSRLETSTFFNLKFYNTYGPSVRYNTPKTNLNLQLVVTLLSEYDGNEYEELRKEIRSYIRKIIDRMNEDQSIKISTLISLLTSESTYGNYISHVEFVGLNDSFEQYIDALEITDKNTEYFAPPEWLNIQPQDLEENILFAYTTY